MRSLFLFSILAFMVTAGIGCQSAMQSSLEESDRAAVVNEDGTTNQQHLTPIRVHGGIE